MSSGNMEFKQIEYNKATTTWFICQQNNDIDILRELLIKVLNIVLLFCELWNTVASRCDAVHQ